jgi:hypothetical protein
MTSTIQTPDPAEVGEVADRLLTAVHADPEYPRLIDGCGRYTSDWTCTTGTITIEGWNLADDAVPLLEEALRALALKAAVYALTGDETTAEIPVAAPVDEVLHAVLAQRTLTERLAERCGFQIVHMTDTEQEADPYEAGGYTWRAYLEAFKVAPPPRYWIGHAEHDRRVAIVSGLLESVGLHDRGRRHELAFTGSAA